MPQKNQYMKWRVEFLLTSGSVKIKALQKEIYEDQRMRVIRREEYVLNRLTQEAEFAENANSRIKALELLGKHVNMFNDKVELRRELPRSSKVKEELKIKLQKFLSS